MVLPGARSLGEAEDTAFCWVAAMLPTAAAPAGPKIKTLCPGPPCAFLHCLSGCFGWVYLPVLGRPALSLLLWGRASGSRDSQAVGCGGPASPPRKETGWGHQQCAASFNPGKALPEREVCWMLA